MSLKSIAMIGSDHIELEINIDYHLCISFTLSKSCRLGLITSQSFSYSGTPCRHCVVHTDYNYVSILFYGHCLQYYPSVVSATH
jgi:hypothetical protein